MDISLFNLIHQPQWSRTILKVLWSHRWRRILTILIYVELGFSVELEIPDDGFHHWSLSCILFNNQFLESNFSIILLEANPKIKRPLPVLYMLRPCTCFHRLVAHLCICDNVGERFYPSSIVPTELLFSTSFLENERPLMQKNTPL